MKTDISGDGAAPELIRQLRASESILEYVASDLKGSDFPGLCLAVEGARAYAEDLLFFFEHSNDTSDPDG